MNTNFLLENHVLMYLHVLGLRTFLIKDNHIDKKILKDRLSEVYKHLRIQAIYINLRVGAKRPLHGSVPSANRYSNSVCMYVRIYI